MSEEETELMDQTHMQLGHEQPKPPLQGRKDTFRVRKAETLLGKRRLEGFDEDALR